jgi:prepilin-type N-terminal cleavage/methylation domain-containing protein
MKYFYTVKNSGFTLIELMVVITIIGILATIGYASFDDARKQSRDKVRMSALKELQLSIELYRAQYGRYPVAGSGCVAAVPVDEFAGPGPSSAADFNECTTYIAGLVPDFISSLPSDPKFENERDRGFYYRTNAAGTSFKLMLYNVVESLPVTGVSHEFARCPVASGACASGVPSSTYAVYSAGAENW